MACGLDAMRQEGGPLHLRGGAEGQRKERPHAHHGHAGDRFAGGQGHGTQIMSMPGPAAHLAILALAVTVSLAPP